MTHRMLLLGFVLILIFTLAACSGQAAPAPAAASAAGAAVAPATTPSATGPLTDTYPDATSVRNQLALGIIRLERTPDAVTAEQAQALLPLWQGMRALTSSSTAATAEVAAVQSQIMAGLTPAQLSAIAALQLTNADLQAYYVEIGVAVERTPEPGATPQGAGMRDVPQDQREAVRATAQALGTPVGSGGGGAGRARRDALLDNVISVLSGK